jgi:CheY-like chemotaxis protein
VVEPRVVDLNVLVADLEKMLGRLIGEDVDLAILAGADLGQVKVDPGQMEQVVMNLCVNARDAMPDGGLLRIRTANADREAGRAVAHEPMAPGRYVMLSVTDAGCGIEEEDLAKIYDPFFTTKERGKGTGLGLSMVYGIVKEAGGYVWVTSAVGQGTTFSIYLPRADEPAAPKAAAEKPLLPGGVETILLVEDEASLRGIAREVLEEHGYQVLEASAASEAIAISRGHAGPIHLLVTDVVMPGMNGRVLAESLAPQRPALAVLFMSGYTDDVIAQRGVLEPGFRLLEKPFSVAALLEGVRRALDGGKLDEVRS